MSKHDKTTLIEALASDVRRIILEAEQLKSLDITEINKKPTETAWSIAQCLQHLNYYCAFYIPAIEQAIDRQETSDDVIFKTGFIGGYFTELMKTDAKGNLKKKMKSPLNATPQEDVDGLLELNTFISHQHAFLNLLHITAKCDLTRIKVPISISKWIRLRLGDVMMFFVEHEKRHLVQIKNVRG